MTLPHRRALVRWANASLRAVLPWPAIAWCEGLYFTQFGVIDGALVTGLSTLSDDLATGQEPYREIAVETRPLDDVYRGNVGFIKIDVEGHEHCVLQGAQRTIAHCRPRMLVEAEERHAPGSVGRIEAFFRQFGYRGYFVQERRLVPSSISIRQGCSGSRT